MGSVKIFLLGILFSLAISACGSLKKFLYKFYIYDYEQGILKGPREADDLNASICAYQSGEYQCIVMKIDEFYRLKTDKEKADRRIDELERNCGRNN